MRDDHVHKIAETNSANTGYEFLLVRTLLDGNSPCVPALTNTTMLGATSPAPYSANTIVHICKNVAAGTHTVQVQYRGDFGSEVQINGHVLTVMHN